MAISVDLLLLTQTETSAQTIQEIYPCLIITWWKHVLWLDKSVFLIIWLGGGHIPSILSTFPVSFMVNFFSVWIPRKLIAVLNRVYERSGADRAKYNRSVELVFIKWPERLLRAAPIPLTTRV